MASPNERWRGIAAPAAPRLRMRLAPCVVVGLYLVVGAAYAARVPPWEAPDEAWHLAYAEALAAGRLPTAGETYEHHQPPSYYLWPALGLRIAGLARVPRAPDNPRYPLATAVAQHPPGDPAVALVRWLRVFCGLLGALPIVLAWATARAAWVGRPRPAGPPLAAAIAVSAVPQYGFITHAISNDTLAAGCGALAAYGLVAWAAGGAPRRAAGCAAAGLALGWLAKLNVLPVAAAVPLALFARWRRDRGADRHALRTAAAGGAVVVTGWAVVATTTACLAPSVHADIVANVARRGIAAGDAVGGAAELARLVAGLAMSLWARFGWLNVDLPWPLYAVPAAGLAVAGVGLARAFRARGAAAPGADRGAVLVALALVAAVLAAAVRNLFADPQPQGRFLFPGLSALGLLLAAGWHGLWGGNCARRGRGAGIVAMVGLTLLMASHVVALGWTLPRAYAPDPTSAWRWDVRTMPARPDVAASLDVAAAGSAGAGLVQSFRAGCDGLRRAEVAAARAPGSGDGGRIVADLVDARGRLLGRSATASARVPVAGAGPPAWVGVDVPPVAGSAGRAYALSVAIAPPPDRAGDGAGSPPAPGSAPRLLFFGVPDADLYPDGALVVDGRAAPGDLALVTWCEP